MKLISSAAALALLCGAPASAQPKDDLMERLSVDHVMRLATLSPARISEMQCAGLGQWLAANQPDGARSPTRAAADRLFSEVQAAIANDTEIPADIVGELLTSLSAEAGPKTGEDERVFAAQVENCAPLFVAAGSPGALKLHPLAAATVVSPALASCYAQYRLAASMTEGEEAAGLNADADRARSLALKGKDDAARAAAEAALEAEYLATKAAPKADQEAGMMRLIMCQPVMAAAAKGNAK